MTKVNFLETLRLSCYKQLSASSNNNLLAGLSGILIFLIAMGDQSSAENLDDDYDSVINNTFDQIQNIIPEILHDFSINTGLSGICWFLEYINQKQDVYDPDFCAEIDAILLQHLSVETWKFEIEALAGLAGIAVYAGRRQRKTDQTILFDKIISHYEALVTEISADQLTWEQPRHSIYRMDKEDRSYPEYNLGLAHGMVGIIASLIPAYSIPSLQSRVRRLIEHSCNWLMSQKIQDEQSIGRYPSSAGSQSPSRLGWCYGDLTIAHTLARAGKLFVREDFIEEARITALKAAARTVENGYCYDAGLCHGSAGNGLCFQLLAQELDMPELQERADFWFNYTLKLYEEKNLKGLHHFNGLSEKYEESHGFLEGYAGIGLCLIAWETGEADWVDCLLLD